MEKKNINPAKSSALKESRESKQKMRREIEEQRRVLALQWLNTASARIVKSFQSLPAFQTSNTIALYKALHGEVQLDALFSACWKLDKRTCIPIFNSTTKRYEMASVSKKTQFKIGHYGIHEPLSPALVPMHAVDLVAVPGVAFDPNGNRLGRGGGYYDQLLAQFSGVTAAVAFDFQLLPHIPCESHDQPVDQILTETKIIVVHNER